MEWEISFLQRTFQYGFSVYFLPFIFFHSFIFFGKSFPTIPGLQLPLEEENEQRDRDRDRDRDRSPLSFYRLSYFGPCSLFLVSFPLFFFVFSLSLRFAYISI
jgi:hypothetical protein